MTERKRHLDFRSGTFVRRTACGLHGTDLLVTSRTREVTCGACRRTLRMAHAELREQQRRDDRARRRRDRRSRTDRGSVD